MPRAIFAPDSLRFSTELGLRVRCVVEDKLVVCALPTQLMIDVFGARSTRSYDVLAAFEVHRDDIAVGIRRQLATRPGAGRLSLAVADFA